MNFLGIGLLELGVILLVAFLVLGPNRSIDLARTAGRTVSTLRRALLDVRAGIESGDHQQFSGGAASLPSAEREEGATPRDLK